METYARVAATGEPAAFDVRIEDLDVDLHVSAHRPQPGHFVAMFTDISDRARADRAAHEERERLLRVIGAFPLAVLITDAAGAVQQFNAAAAELLGVEPSLGAVAGRDLRNVWWPRTGKVAERGEWGTGRADQDGAARAGRRARDRAPRRRTPVHPHLGRAVRGRPG